MHQIQGGLREQDVTMNKTAVLEQFYVRIKMQFIIEFCKRAYGPFSCHYCPYYWPPQAVGLKRAREEDVWSRSRAHQQKRAETAALSTVHTIKDLEQGSGGGEVPKTLYFKGLELFLHWGQYCLVVCFCGNTVQLWKYSA